MPKRKQGRPTGTTKDPALAVRPCTFNITDETKEKIDRLRDNKARGKWITMIVDRFYP
jgi:hypothetical protein